jgi:hypothetical protein
MIMDEQVKAIIKKLIEKSEKGEIGWRESGHCVFKARISDCTVTTCMDYPDCLYAFEIHGDKAGLIACLCACGSKDWSGLPRLLYCAAQEAHERDVDEALKSLAESLVEAEVEDPALTAILDRGVRSLGLSCRAVNGLICGDLDTVRDIVSLTSAKELLRIRGLGSASIREIENFLSESGLSFGMKLTTK